MVAKMPEIPIFFFRFFIILIVDANIDAICTPNYPRRSWNTCSTGTFVDCSLMVLSWLQINYFNANITSAEPKSIYVSCNLICEITCSKLILGSWAGTLVFLIVSAHRDSYKEKADWDISELKSWLEQGLLSNGNVKD